jgi:phospholipase D-like protein
VAWRLITNSVLDEVVGRIDGAQHRILIASPFIGRAVGQLLAGRIALNAGELGARPVARLLTAYTEAAIDAGALSAVALEAFLDAGVVIRTIPNLHAKTVVIDSWALVGSGNLSQSGMDSLNVELGLAGIGRQAETVAATFDEWWRHASRAPDARVTRADVRAGKARERAAQRVAARSPGHRPKGQALSRPTSKRLRDQLTNATRARAAASLRADLDMASGSPQPSIKRTMDGSAAYWNVAALWLDRDDPDRHQVRALLLQVLLRHPDESARGHAAWRLSRDGWPPSGPTQRVIAAVDTARRRDPAFVVRRNAARALSGDSV